ncbi:MULTISPECIES: molybdopterin-synthase adenylyltransferase MoeB [unclassified Lentimonas]|uniref:molybdopterin-synthase adenylyltransferase MoeB n=1 Tax=unclassified Lentimonas TaxID=2630993 RepID=UPI00132BDA15|nr:MULTISPECIES: molybdopterin-synthase adenylyltransferase MoeB [unclassified Lentimonas]CAA6677842.1 Sulfur carrier protein adenylyltransferase ThiF [Lentimonas sp. CC4]CAA6683945.1 Sulfur carrier protein adenylyltransferase ThiF [Lentimonas sp. CC6]CAA7076678.1 Sulfur carrier protein adenylyltransferase ThiF [Lentimonas sp. CC4]CAA7169993.1 Sulfur carrier protein adenylyltransferase ThiF [Lentimonas sp. CC21]CAA7181277.1 Sulfur carrier protein adenylyltransferase ThiF [Lentimonas sp. CC8]
MDLSQSELLRYQRHLTLPGFGETAQLQLKAARVLVIGAGGLGCPALQYLAAAGVGTLGIVDDDRVSRSNLQRQILYTDADVGQMKADVAAARLMAINPDINAVAHPTRLSVDNAIELISGYDVVLDGSDNFPTRYLVNDACVLASKPLVYGALYTFQGQASVFNYQGGPTYRCLFPVPPNPKDAPNCSEIGVLGVLPGMVGTIQATEVIKVLTGIGTPLSGKLLIFDALEMSQTVVQFKRVPEAANVTELTEVEFACGISSETASEEISAEALRAKLADGERPLQMIDVRESWERELCKIDSLHIPLKDALGQQVDLSTLGLRADLPTVVYCKGGVRSMKALKALKAHYGFSEIKSLQGGILAWGEQIDCKIQPY